MTEKPTRELVTLPDGRQGYRDKHGGIRNDKGEWLQRPPGSATIFAGQRAVEMGRRRVAKAKEAARKRLAERAKEAGLQRSSVAAVALLADEAYQSARAGFKGDLVVNADGSEWYRQDRRGSVDAAKFALKWAGYGDEGVATAAPVDGLAVSGQGIAFLAELVARAVAGQQAPQVVDGEARDITEGSDDIT